MTLSLEVHDNDPWSHIYVPLIVWGIAFSSAILISAIISLGVRLLGRDYKSRRDGVFSMSSNSLNKAALLAEERFFLVNQWVIQIEIPYPARAFLLFCQALMSLLTAGMSAYISSSEDSPGWWNTLAFFFLVFFTLYLMLRSVLTPRPFLFFVLTPGVAVDLLSIVSMSYSYNNYVSFMFLRVHPAVHAIKKLIQLTLPPLMARSLSTQITLLVLESSSLIYTFAIIIYILEKIGDPPGAFDDNSSEFTLFGSVYFIFITLTTVGYGDYTAQSYLGRSAVIIFVIFGIALFAEHISKLVEFINASQSGYGSFYNTYDEPFVILTGDVSFDMIVEFVKGLCHKDAALDFFDFRRKIVVLTKKNDSDSSMLSNLKLFQSNNPEYSNSITVLNGSPFNHMDLVDRASGKSAQCVFVVSDIHSNDIYTKDTTNTLRSMAVYKSLPDVPVYLAVTNPVQVLDRKHPIVKSAIYASRFKMEVFALSCFAEGVPAFFYTGIQPYAIERPRRKGKSSEYKLDDEFSTYDKECVLGAEKEFYVVSSPEWLFSQRIGDACFEQYSLSGVLIVGLARPVVSEHVVMAELGRSTSKEAPRTYHYDFVFHADSVIEEGSVLLVLANNARQARAMGPGDRVGPTLENDESEQVTLEMSTIRNSDRKDSRIDRDSKATSKHRKNRRASSLKKRNSISVDFEEESPKYFADGDVSIAAPSRSETQHIVIICSHTNGIGFFINSLRQVEKSLDYPEYGYDKDHETSVVILCENPLKLSDFSEIRDDYLKHVKYVQGDLQQDMFHRCRLEYSKKVILTNFRDSNHIEHTGDKVSDLETIFCWFRINQYLRMKGVFNKEYALRPQIIVEIQKEQSLSFFQSISDRLKVGKTEGIWESDLFSAGEILPLSIAPRILMASYLNGGFMQFIKKFFSLAGKSHNILSIPVGRLFSKSNSVSYETVFRKLVFDDHVIPVAVYRNASHRTCQCKHCSLNLSATPPNEGRPHLYTCPPFNLEMCSQDLVLGFAPTKNCNNY